VQHDAPFVVVLVTEPAGDPFDLFDDAVVALGPGARDAELQGRSISGHHFSVDIDYRAEKGRSGPRRVAPYSFRRTQEGNIVLFVVNDHGQLRSYRADRITGIRPTSESFVPVFRVEF